MKVLLLFRDREFDSGAGPPPQAPDLVQDLGLEVLFAVMAARDQFLYDMARRTVLGSLTEPEAIAYRQQALSDCAQNPDVVRAIYDLTVETITHEKKIFTWFSEYSPELNLHRAVDVMQLLTRMLKRLRQIAVDNAQRFRSPAFERFFAMLLEELDDPYFELVSDHLRRLQFGRGVLISAGLGKGNSAVEIVLRRPHDEKVSWSELILGPRDGRHWFQVHPRDEAGHHALEELRGRGINLVADALAQSADHVLGFFVQLRAELAFYLGCLNLRSALEARGSVTCLPDPRSAADASLSAVGLYDASLALSVAGGIVPNDLGADGKRLVVITGANQGGKSTFLRSVGMAQLMMQAGMFVPAARFQASVSSAVFTHFKREEDEAMTSGRLDEELSRLSRTVDRIQTGGLLLCNESFASTNEPEGSEIGEQVIAALTEEGVRVVLVTHLIDLAERFRRRQPERTLFLRAERLPDGKRTFKIREGEPLTTSFGRDLYEAIFAHAE